jgi:hypothetical protein
MTQFLISNPLISLMLLFAGGVIIFTVIALGVWAWKASSASLDEAYKIMSSSKDVRQMLIGLILFDVLIGIFLVRPYPDPPLIYILLGVNSFFLYFIYMGYVAVRRAKKRIEALQSQAFSHPQTFSHQSMRENRPIYGKGLRKMLMDNRRLIFWFGFLVLEPAAGIILKESIPNPTLAQYIGTPIMIVGAACIYFAIRRR